MDSVIILSHSTRKYFARPAEGNQLWAGKPYRAAWRYEEGGGV